MVFMDVEVGMVEKGDMEYVTRLVLRARSLTAWVMPCVAESIFFVYVNAVGGGAATRLLDCVRPYCILPLRVCDD
jgi:hypothetical protein